MEKTDKTIAKILQQAIQFTRKNGDFIITKGQDLINEYIKYTIAESSLFIILSLVGLYIGYKILKQGLDGIEDSFDTFPVFKIAGGLLLLVFSIFNFIEFSHRLITVCIAPNIFLIKEFMT